MADEKRELRYRRAPDLVVGWIDGQPTHRLVERVQSGVKAALGVRTLALLERGDVPRTLEELVGLLAGDGEGGGGDEDEARKIVSRLLELGFLEAAEPLAPGAEALARPFHSFGEFASYHAMLADKRRVSAYRSAIENAIRPGMAVLEIGAGTGILSVFAARAGATVYAIERRDVIQIAREVVRAAGVEDRVHLIHAHSSRVELPAPADALICELIGRRIVNEAMFESMLDARLRLLKPDGVMIPDELRIIAYPVWTDTPDQYRGSLSDIEGHSGVPVKPLVDWFTRGLEESRFVLATEPDAPGLEVRGDGVEVARVALREIEAPGFSGRATLSIREAGELNAILLAFDAALAPGVTLDNRLESPSTSWTNPVYPLAAPRRMAAGDRFDVTVEFQAGRDLDVRLDL